ncbi:hypothetical protein K435DRAFT_854935 [Dendrothele bispora CBS 962.96]|uniref:F-box domain-containing protein n=1 Tax=Dendrothele bispora (strain CBS 962.96) TaxID=1314807 RepID=A0A4S8MCZ1_DENBC|nr:hypothetical protein K435DRAFT_854935 [Dendrothele bispora CBS 962.96]
MESHQKQPRKKAKTSNSIAPIRRSSRVAARQGWRIPPEILLLIMNELRDSKASLQKAALVCRAWRGPAQSYLFSQMCIRRFQDCRRILKIIQKSPHIALHVNRLVVAEYIYLSLPVFGSTDDRPTKRMSYLRSKDAMEIASVLGSSVRELGVSVCPLDENNVEFLKHMRRVQTLRIRQCGKVRLDILAGVIQCMRDITALHLFGGIIQPDLEDYEADRLKALTDTTTSSAVSSTIDIPPLRLTRLTLDNLEYRFDLLKFLLDPRHFDLGSLEDLDLAWMEDQVDITTLDYTSLDRLIGRVGTNLKSLTLGFSGGRHPPRDRYMEHYTMSPTTSPLRCLVTLESFSIISQEINRLDPSPYLALLASVSPSSINRVKLTTHIDVEDFHELSQFYFALPEKDPAQHWKAVDSLLGDEDRFPVLQNFTITVVLEFQSELTKLILNDIEGCGNSECSDCEEAIEENNELKEMMNRHAKDSVDRTSTRIRECLRRL